MYLTDYQLNTNKKPAHRRVFYKMIILRSRADSNRCGSFCRALPNHSATGPIMENRSVSKTLQEVNEPGFSACRGAKIKQSKEI